jgi:rsbT co-antagonist protein RsbR
MSNYSEEARLEQLIDVIGSMAMLDFSTKAFVDDSDSQLNAIATGLNMLAEELEITIVSKADLEEKNKELAKLAEANSKAAEAIAEMSTPISRLWEGILLLPLVGMMTSVRIKSVMTAVLENISATQAKVIILDISGVSLVDTYIANHFIKIAKATRLMGCVCVLSGITPMVAQTIVELGVNVDEIETTGTMKDALERAFAYTDVHLLSKERSE